MRKNIKHNLKKGDTFTLSTGNTAIITKYTDSDNILIRIKETGTRLNVRSENVVLGRIRDPNFKAMCNVGYIGIGKHSPTLFSDGLGAIPNPVYKLWTNVINRCYGKNKRKHYEGVTTCKRWHCFQNFANDVQKLPGFDEWVKGAPLDFDKDTRIKQSGDKQYNRRTCHFISQEVNRKGRLKSV